MLEGLPAETSQLIVVAATGPGEVKAMLCTLEKREGTWHVVRPVSDVVVGRSGFALPGEKHEGDGRTPSGIFPLRRAFGYAASVSTRMPYRQVTEHDIWVDDPASSDYNKWMKRGETEAASFEKMLRPDGLYRYGIVIEYNTEPIVPGMGSAIFFHIWKGPDRGTAGCVAMGEILLVQLLAWLDPARNPVAVLGVLPPY